ncbi:hypothetical protein H9L13_00225 [Sphingomonas lutea]|uniref:PAS domain-containing protein n=1 Tax=Sphingomonas lutea TaxID=1045317 RepID=A0A7G9SHW8_9SPHN|nr:hypothetical protein [Sphingomonas lutea]QNN67443.1 hypothetical protein H9L13_00225 [Sphingomonas lutea]
MDGFRGYPSDFEPSVAADASAAAVAAAIGTDERRMHVRAYNYWVSLLDGRDFPSIEDLEPGNLEDFSAHSVLLDFTCGRDSPAMPYIGGAIREECGLADDARTTSEVPSRSLLSRLTDHYLQIIANRAPIGFEAEYVNQREENICYRGILMPFSSDGETIDFIYGVINWKAVDATPDTAFVPMVPMLDLASAADVPDAFPELLLGGDDEAPPADVPAVSESADEHVQPVPHFSWEDGPLHDDSDDDGLAVPALDADAGLADRLWAAREGAEAVKLGEGRTRGALYAALALAYDFSLAATDDPEGYAEILDDSGVKAQARAPMTPVVKLVFGVDYDKARLTEFAAALSHAHRQQVEAGKFRDFIEGQAGGLKALVAAERAARRPGPRPDDRGDAARAKLRRAPAIALADVPVEAEFAVVVTRRSADGQHQLVAVLNDEPLAERVIRRAA